MLFKLTFASFFRRCVRGVLCRGWLNRGEALDLALQRQRVVTRQSLSDRLLVSPPLL